MQFLNGTDLDRTVGRKRTYVCTLSLRYTKVQKKNEKKSLLLFFTNYCYWVYNLSFNLLRLICLFGHMYLRYTSWCMYTYMFNMDKCYFLLHVLLVRRKKKLLIIFRHIISPADAVAFYLCRITLVIIPYNNKNINRMTWQHLTLFSTVVHNQLHCDFFQTD